MPIQKAGSPFLYSDDGKDIVGIKDPDGSEQYFANFGSGGGVNPSGLEEVPGPLQGEDLALVSRSGVALQRTTLDALAFYDSLKNDDIVSSNAVFPAFQRLAQIDRGEGRYFGIACHGDSMADPNGYSLSLMGLDLFRRFRCAAVASPNFGYSGNNITWTFGNGASQPRNDFTYLPGANQVIVPPSGSARLLSPNIVIGSQTASDGGFSPVASDSSTIDFTKVSFYYLTRPGDGQMRLFVRQPMVPNPAQVVGKAANSTTSNVVGLGSKTFTVETGKAYVAGDFVEITSRISIGNYMIAEVVSYDSGTGALVVSSQYFQGTGTIADWVITTPAYAPQTVNCDSTLNITKFEYSLLDSTKKADIGVFGVTGTSLLVGCMWWRKGGVLLLGSQVGGSSMVNQNNYIRSGNHLTLYRYLLEDLNVGLVIHRQRCGGDGDWRANYVEMFDSYDALNALSTASVPSYYAQFVIGEPPRGSNQGAGPLPVPESAVYNVLYAAYDTVEGINAFLRQQCVNRGYAFLDEYRMYNKSLALLQSIGWADNDVTHLDTPAHRYSAKKYLEFIGNFESPANPNRVFPVTLAELNNQRFRLAAIDEMRTHRIEGHTGRTLTGQVATNYTFTADDEKGYLLRNVVGVGSIAGRVGVVPFNSGIGTVSGNVAVGFSGYRNINMLANTRSFVIWGVTATFSSLTALNQRSFGLEFALGSDVGSPSGVTTQEVFRFFWHDGTSINYGPWLAVGQPGGGSIDGSGGGFAVVWNRLEQTFTVYRGVSTGTAMPMYEVKVPVFAASNAGGHWINICLRDDSDQVPGAPAPVASANAVFFSALNFWAKWNEQVYWPFGNSPSNVGAGT